MGNLKAVVKQLFYKTGTTFLLDKLLFYAAFLKNKKANKKFAIENPAIKIPPDYFLYETFLLNYEKYINPDAAFEIIDWTKKYLNDVPCAVLEWGCGVARIVRHLPKYLPFQ